MPRRGAWLNGLVAVNHRSLVGEINGADFEARRMWNACVFGLFNHVVREHVSRLRRDEAGEA